MSPTDDDSLLDAMLRDTPHPAGLLERLHGLADWPDDELDHALLGVPVASSALMNRLKEITDDAPVEDSLREVSLPPLLLFGLKAETYVRPARPVENAASRGRRRLVQVLSLSLSLLLVVGYAGFTWSMLEQARDTDTVAAGPLRIDFQLISSVEDDAFAIAALSDDGIAMTVDEQFSSDPIGAAASEVDPVRKIVVIPNGPVGEALAIMRDPTVSAFLHPLDVTLLGAPPADDAPRMTTIGLPAVRGTVVPIVKGYDRAFLLREGVHPPIDPRIQALRTSLAPLSTETEGFDAALFALRHDQRPTPETIRTEDFIAALQYDYPTPKPGMLGLQAYAGPSPYGVKGAAMLHLGVKAGEATLRTVKAAHLILAIDLSSGLEAEGRWEALVEAIPDTLRRLGPRDRMSLLVFQDDVVLRTEPLTKESFAELRGALAGVHPARKANWSRGLEAVWQTAMESGLSPDIKQRIVFLSDGRSQLSAAAAKRLQSLFADAADKIAGFEVLDVGQGADAAAVLVDLAVLLGREPSIRTVRTRREAVQALLQAAHGDAATAASEAKMKVTFDPNVVASYRLLGHEANAMAQLSSPAAEVELYPGDEATVLFELSLRSDNTTPAAKSSAAAKPLIAATIDLTWVDPAAGAARSVRKTIARSELFTAWDKLPAPFRRAALAAETAETLRESRLKLGETQGKAVAPLAFASLAADAKKFPWARERTWSDERLLKLLEGLKSQRNRSG